MHSRPSADETSARSEKLQTQQPGVSSNRLRGDRKPQLQHQRRLQNIPPFFAPQFSLCLQLHVLFSQIRHTIDEQSFQDLQVILNMAKDIEQKNQGNTNNFPSFLWVIRDFAL